MITFLIHVDDLCMKYNIRLALLVAVGTLAARMNAQSTIMQESNQFHPLWKARDENWKCPLSTGVVFYFL